ncbi:MAG: uroporphyrinogen decarboxylase, partial [Anaerolineales bacterium]
WFMRQAGRYLPEYRALREKYSLLDLCRNPNLAAQVTLQPVHALGVDAAILFADILLPLIPMGAKLTFSAGEGPVIENPVRSAGDIRSLRPVAVEQDLGYVLQTLRLVRRELPELSALIGFAGAPFTLASYLVEGGPSRPFRRTKQLMYAEPAAWHDLMEKLSRVLIDYLGAQVGAGAQAIQLFDSWAGALSLEDYQTYVASHSAAVLAAVRQTGVPAIHFGTGTSGLLEAMRDSGGDVIGVDWRIPLDRAWERLGPSVALQGNLDPVALFAPRPELERQVRTILKAAGGRPGHIFNLGHGVLPETPVESVKAVVEMVHKFSVRVAV